MTRRSLLLLCGLSLTACAEAPSDVQDGLTIDAVDRIVNGTRTNQLVPLDEGQRLAIGWLHSPGWVGGNFCTGTLIAPRVVITASHCTVGRSARSLAFGLGTFPSDARGSFQVVGLHEHARLDAAILVLDRDVTQSIPSVKPIPFNRQTMERSWVGRSVEASGFGETRNRNRSGRWFAVLRLAQVYDDEVVVDGEGERGICFGDSGGPLLGVDPQGRTRVLAVESRGATSCVGRDWMTRLDAISAWIDPVLQANGGGDEQPPGDAEPPQDPEPGRCDELSYSGRCDGDVAQWCNDGVYHERDCAGEGKECRFLDNARGYYCGERVDPDADLCQQLGYHGRCNNAVSEYCYEGEVRREDCAAQGLVCRWVNDETGNDCAYSEANSEQLCEEIGYHGRCQENVAEYCLNGILRRDDCGQRGQDCAWINNESGYYCR